MRNLLVCLVLLGAAQAAAAENTDPSVECGKRLAADDRFSGLARLVPLAGMESISFEMLANEGYPTDKERKAIVQWVPEHKECLKSGEQFRREHYPVQIVALIDEAEGEVMAVTADLYNKKLNYAAANKKLQAIGSDIKNRMAAVVQQIQSQQQAQREAEAGRDAATRQAIEDRRSREAAQAAEAEAADNQARRQMAAQILLNGMRQNQPVQVQPYMLPTQPTVNTNCSQFGNSWNCTSR